MNKKSVKTKIRLEHKGVLIIWPKLKMREFVHTNYVEWLLENPHQNITFIQYCIRVFRNNTKKFADEIISNNESKEYISTNGFYVKYENS